MTSDDDSHAPERRAVDGRGRNEFRDLGRRIYLTYKHRGAATLLYRAVTFPLRFTPLASYLRLGPRHRRRTADAAAWYRRFGQPVTIVIPSYRDAVLVSELVRGIRKTTPRRMVTNIVVADDASGPEHVAALRRIPGIEVVAGEQNVGFSGNVNRGLRAVQQGSDAVLLNSDVLPTKGWLASLQYATRQMPDVGLVGAKLLYPDNRIQYGGTVRNLGAPEWFDHRYRFKPADWGPSEIPGPTLAVTGACMYITSEALQRVGPFDEAFPMGYEDVDYSLRTWQVGLRVMYEPSAVLYHLESVTRGTEVGERERKSQRAFWRTWATFFDARDVRTESGALRVIYVTEDTGVGGGHRDIFEHLNGLRARGHKAELWTLGKAPEWFPLQVPVRSFDNYEKLTEALAPVRAIKVATWWNTAAPVWHASILHGIAVYFVQDIETSYYANNPEVQDAVLDSYRREFRYMTISTWNRDRLLELGLDAELIPPGIELQNFRPLPDIGRRDDMVLALGRSNPLKNLRLTIAAWRRLPTPRPELCLFGIEPELAEGESSVRYVTAPSDEEVSRLLNEATVFVQTSTHEGFCLPPLESMATGGAVVCTDAHGNRDFCVDGENCLMPEPNAQSVSEAIQRLLADPALRKRLGGAGIKTAADYSWGARIDALERFLEEVARPRRIAPSTSVVPQGPRA